MQLKPFDLKCLLCNFFLGDQLNKQERKKGGGLFCFALNQNSSSHDTTAGLDYLSCIRIYKGQFVFLL
jgi:hypothetical protein